MAHLKMIVPKVENRPITSNGLAGFRPATTQHGRITKDRLYWLGEIKRRSRMIQEEIQSLEQEQELITVEHEEYVSTKKLASQTAASLQEEQNKLSDFNLIIEKETLGHEEADLHFEREKLEEVNFRESDSLRQIFENRSQAQDELDKVEVEIKNAINKTDTLVETMNEIESETFLSHRNQLAKVSEQIDGIENEIADAKKQCIRLEGDLQQDLSRLELSPLYIQIHVLQAKLADLSGYLY